MAEQYQLLTLAEVKELTGLGRSAVYDNMARGDFPKPLKIGMRAVRWRRTEIEEFIASAQRATYTKPAGKSSA